MSFNNTRETIKVLLPHYLYCHIVYSTIPASNILKYRDTRKSTSIEGQRFKSTFKMITLIFLD